MSDFKERLRMALEVSGISQNDFCKRTGFSQANTCHFLSGQRDPTLGSIQKILKALPCVDARWLIGQAAERDALKRAAKVCEWEQDTDYETEIWHTSCGEAFVFNEGGPDENFLKFCCYCGMQLKAIRALAGKE